MLNAKRTAISFVKKLDLASALAVRLTKITGKSKVPLHPKHLLTQKPWFTRYIVKNDVVLDLGCGNGQSVIKAAKVAKKVIGVDVDDNFLKIAKESADRLKIKNIKFEKTDLEQKLKFKENSFDKVIFLDVLEHLKNRDQILSEIRRVLKPSGLLFLGVPNKGTSWKKLQRSLGVCSYSDPDHKIEFSEQSIKKLLAKHGFQIANFGYGKYDIPLRGLVDIIGGLSLPIYKSITNWRVKLARKNPREASGFEIVAENVK